MGENKFAQWMRLEVLAFDSKLQRASVLIFFYLLALAILYLHLVLFPQEFREGQVVPYTIFAPVTYNYVNTEELDILNRKDVTTVVIDESKLTQALNNLAGFELQLNELRLKMADSEATDTVAGITEISLAYGLDPEIVEEFTRFDENKLRSVMSLARIGLENEMQKSVTEDVIRVLKRGGTSLVLNTPREIYIWFLVPNLMEVATTAPEEDNTTKATEEVVKGSVIIAEGGRVDRTTAEKLAELTKHLELQNMMRFLGLGMILALLLLIWYQYGARYAPQLARVNTISQLAVLFLVFMAIGLFLIGRLPFSYFYYGVVFSVAALTGVTVMIYETRFAILFGVGLGIILSVALNFGAALALFTVAGALLPAVLLSPGCTSRKQVWFLLAQTLYGVLFSLAVILVSVQTLHWEPIVIAGAAGFTAAVVTIGLLPLVETMSVQLTHNKLIELANPENELLKRLKHEAHGTYAHSQMVADLAEEACKEIGVDELLAKVGALYHDIGKLKRPGFFAENIHDLSKNPHQGLPPLTSVKILKDHVTDGLLMANEAHLPIELHQYIAEHHGTYKIRYFYFQAMALHEQDPEAHPAPVKEDFCYLGPKPSTKESGIVMLADVTEAVVRAKTDADNKEVMEIVDRIFSEKIEEGQLIDSGLTIGDLEKVKSAFKRILAARRHTRVQYPGTEKGASPMQFHYPTRELQAGGKSK